MTRDEAVKELSICKTDDGWVSRDGTYFSGLRDLALGELGLCECSSDSVTYVTGLLSELNTTPPPYWSDGPREFFLNVMDRLGVVDHGTSIRGSWLTPRGHALLVLLAEDT